jgi:hypothetical protein
MIAGALMLAGCAAAPAEPGIPEQGAGRCNAAPALGLVGSRRSEAVGAEAMRRSGATTLRWIGPDAIITQDLRSDRINIDLDAGGRVTGLRCF